MSLHDDFAHRELCPDGGCVGVIGPDGRCKVCGKVSPSEVRDPRREFAGAVMVETAALPAADDHHDHHDHDDHGDDFDERRLCPDGACVGLLGDDGRCRVCGKAGA